MVDPLITTAQLSLPGHARLGPASPCLLASLAPACFCRATLIVVGHVESLQTNPRWSALVSHARKQHCMFKAGEWHGGQGAVPVVGVWGQSRIAASDPRRP